MSSRISNNNNSISNNNESFFVDLELNLNSLLEHLLNKTVVNNKVDLSAASTKTIVSLIDQIETHNETVLSNVLTGMRVAEFFSVYRFHLLIVFVVLLGLIIVILSLMVFNFIARNEADKSSGSGATSESSSASANKKLMLKYKKNKNTSFDIIDVGGYYKPARRSSSSFKLFNTNSSNLANFNRSNSTTETQLVVDYDYQFENFNNQAQPNTNAAANLQQIQQLSSSRTFDKIISLNEHFYEMPAINNYTSLMTAAALATSRRGGSDFDDLLASMNNDDATRFKTFSVRKYEKEKQKFDQSNCGVTKSNSTRVDCGGGGGKAIITAEDIRIGTNNLKKTNPVVSTAAAGSNEISLRLNTNDLRNNMIMEIYEPSISICFDKISLSDLSSVDKQSF